MHLLHNSFVRFAAVGLAVAAGGLALARAQTAVSPNRVTFFTEPNFQGEALTVEAGAAVESLDNVARVDRRPWTFAISSVRVEGGAQATVFSAPAFRGERLEITASVADLYGFSRGPDRGTTWDRAIASLTVTGPRRGGPARPPSAPPGSYETAPPPPPGTYQTGPPPTTVTVIPTPPPLVREMRPRYDPRTVDLIIQRAFRDVLLRSADPDGLRHYRQKLLREGWTERQVVQDLQRSGEARAINADEAITRAYRETLGREPDQNGLNHYRKLWREGWTQGQIREDLRRSGEGRDAGIRAAITRAYREVLGREPDPAGYAVYEKAMREKGWSERKVREALMSGDEYRSLHPRR